MPAPEITMLPLSRIALDPTFSARAEKRPAEVVREIAEAMADKEFPPILVYDTGPEVVVVDGWYRVLAARELGRSAIAAEVRVGSRREARLAAAASNSAHGVRRTAEDKRRAVIFVLDEAPDWTIAKVAAHVGVSVSLVVGLVEVRKRMPAVTPAEVAEKGAREVLGKPKVAPKPAPKQGPATAKPPDAQPAPPATANPWVGVLEARRRDEDHEPEQDTPSASAVANVPEFDVEAEEDEAHEEEITREMMMRAGRKWIRFAETLGLDLHATLDEIIADMAIKAAVARRRGRPEKVPPTAGDSPHAAGDE